MSGRTLLLLLGAALLLLGGCTTVEKRLSAKEYYNQANEAYDREDFSTAVDIYHDLLDQYPLNPYAEEAQLKIAYSYYIEKKYAEAIAGFSDFERAYPTSIHLPFVEYYRGMCYLEQMRSIDRDQSVTEKAYD
jgi:outer membrane protein assembly factor BamD